MPSLLAAGRVPSSEIWAWHAHPEVWVLVGALAGLYIYAAKVIGPKVVPAGTPPVTRRQWLAFGAAMLAALVRVGLAGARHRRAVPVLRAHEPAPAAHAGHAAAVPPRHPALAGRPRARVGTGPAGGAAARAAGRRRRRLQRDGRLHPLAAGGGRGGRPRVGPLRPAPAGGDHRAPDVDAGVRSDRGVADQPARPDDLPLPHERGPHRARAPGSPSPPTRCTAPTTRRCGPSASARSTTSRPPASS